VLVCRRSHQRVAIGVVARRTVQPERARVYQPSWRKEFSLAGTGRVSGKFSRGCSGNGFLPESKCKGKADQGERVVKIDHPLEPAKKVPLALVVRSPDMMNVYTGNVTTTAGTATVILPDYFEALNRDFRYQLT